MKISIDLDAYEIVNLLQALNVVPNNGDWKLSVILKIIDGVENLGWTKEKLQQEYMANSGMSIKDMKRHVEILEWKQKHRKTPDKEENANISI